MPKMKVGIRHRGRLIDATYEEEVEGDEFHLRMKDGRNEMLLSIKRGQFPPLFYRSPKSGIETTIADITD